MTKSNDVRKAPKKLGRLRSSMASSIIITVIFSTSVISINPPRWPSLRFDNNSQGGGPFKNEGNPGNDHNTAQQSNRNEFDSTIIASDNEKNLGDENKVKFKDDDYSPDYDDEFYIRHVPKAAKESIIETTDPLIEEAWHEAIIDKLTDSDSGRDHNTTRYKTNPRIEEGRRESTETSFHVFPEAEYVDKTEAFLRWCKEKLGIDTLLKIQTFEHFDYMKAMPAVELEDDLGTDASDSNEIEDPPLVAVRGLAAMEDIGIGKVVIRIPLKSLWSVATIIDNDTVLGGNVMGPEGRNKNGWHIKIDLSTSDKTDIVFYEIPLLAVALLYHVHLGNTSAYAPYVSMLRDTPVDSMPFLWSAKQLKESPVSSEGLRTVARGIRQEMRDMYSEVVEKLIEQHPGLFGKDVLSDSGGEWMFSYQKFQWAFAIINSRHWQLPIEEFESDFTEPVTNRISSSIDEVVLPASTPTENWVQEHGEIDNKTIDRSLHLLPPTSHSFLAPVADLMNFGPPCTRGRYNKESHTFDIIATCNFKKGEEVTFWYSDECQHVIMGIYGFSHPLIPLCPSTEDLRLLNEELEDKLADTINDLEMMQKELEFVEEILIGCDCCHYEKKRQSERSPVSSRRSEDPAVSGSRSRKRHGKPGVRRMYSRRSEF